MDGAEKLKKNNCDFVVALGGGSVIDCSKCIALMVSNSGDIWDYSLSKEGGKKNAEFDAIPIVAITTSAGTGSEVDIAAVISDDNLNEKTGIFFPSMFPKISVVDSELMMSVPPNFTAYKGMDAFFHASESVINKNEHPMEHVMGSYHSNLVHGAGLIMIAHEYYDFFAERKAAEEPMIKMAKAMGIENVSSEKDFIKALDELIAAVGCAELKMSEAGITQEELKLYTQRIHEVLGGDITADPLPLSDKDYLEIYQKSFS